MIFRHLRYMYPSVIHDERSCMIEHELDPGVVGVGEHVDFHVVQSAGIMKDFVKDVCWPSPLELESYFSG
jgi:hypothetical protein